MLLPLVDCEAAQAAGCETFRAAELVWPTLVRVAIANARGVGEERRKRQQKSKREEEKRGHAHFALPLFPLEPLHTRMAKDTMSKDSQVHSSPSPPSLRMAAYRPHSPPQSPARTDSTQNQGISGSGTSYWNKTSFKLSKTKTSKAKHLTKSELVGISLSILLSFLFALVIAFTIYITTPIIIKQASNLLEDLRYISAVAKGKGGGVRLSESKQSLSAVVPDMSTAEFLSVYHNKMPAVFQTSDEHAVMDLFQSSVLSPESMGKQLPLRRLDWYADQSLPAVGHRTLAELLHGMESLSPTPSSSQEYYFVSDDFAEAAQVLREEVCGTTDFVDREKNSFFQSISQSVKLSVGRNAPAFSGSPFHAHTQTLNYLLVGKKQWVLFPPKTLPSTGFNPLRNLRYWRTMSSSSPDSSTSSTASASPSADQPLVFTQSAGQWVYIPDGWLHATETLSNVSVAISFSASTPARSSYLHFLQQGDRKMFMGDYEGAIKMYKLGLGLSRNGSLLRRLGAALKALGLFSAAEETYREAIRVNPLDALSFAELLGVLVTSTKWDASDDISALLAQAELLGVRDQVLMLTDDSLS